MLSGNLNRRGSVDLERLAQLAARQHWMDRFVLPLLAVLFTFSIALAARQYLAVFFPSVKLPGWVVAAAGFLALESVYAAGLHLRLRTPLSLRALEFALLLLPVYGGLWAAEMREKHAFLSLSSFRDPRLFIPLGLAAFAWSFARDYGVVFARLGDIARDVGDQGAATFSWEGEAYFSDYAVGQERSRAVGYFTRRLLFYAFLACLCEALVIEAFPHRAAGLPGWRRITSLGVVLMLFSGLLLQACVYLYRLHSIWREVGIKVQGDLIPQWLRAGFVFVCLVTAAALLLPWGLSPFSFTAGVQSIGNWLAGGFRMPLPEQGVVQPSFGPPVTAAPLAEGGGSWLALVLYFGLSLILAVTIVGMVLGIIGLLIIGFLQDEWERLPALLKLPAYVYLWLKETAAQLLALAARGLTKGSRLAARFQRISSRFASAVTEREKPVRQRVPPSTFALYIRHLFVLMVEAAQAGGLPPKASHTPLEYTQGLAQHLGCGQQELEEFTQYYLKARYSGKGLSEDIRPVVDALWQQIMGVLKTQRIRAQGEHEQRESGEDQSGELLDRGHAG